MAQQLMTLSSPPLNHPQHAPVPYSCFLWVYIKESQVKGETKQPVVLQALLPHGIFFSGGPPKYHKHAILFVMFSDFILDFILPHKWWDKNSVILKKNNFSHDSNQTLEEPNVGGKSLHKLRPFTIQTRLPDGLKYWNMLYVNNKD